MGNGASVSALVVGTYVLNLTSALVLNLDDCYYALALTKNIIYVSYLNKKGFHLTFRNNGFFFISLNGVLYASGTL